MSKPLFTRRLTKELKDLSLNPPEGVTVEDASTFKSWVILIDGAPGTLYEGEHFKLEARSDFSVSLYAIIPIGVTRSVVHKAIHSYTSTIYSNGHICLNILYKDWSPVQTVAQICLSIQSMLSSCSKKELPPDNDLYVRNANSSPKKTSWAFHDDTV
ncbi:ubiquitin-conjugating enzyme/RWD-like protein [Umbelopsis sp. PMI_123]|nr:ubiquitin-conjugating enzyme/RWD-like protein [Umbelopsis sp. PMI_123]